MSRKPFLLLHRSHRFVEPNPLQFFLSFVAAAALSAWLAWHGTAVIHVHELLRERILRWSGVPISGHAIFGLFGMQGEMAVSPMAAYDHGSWLYAVACAIPILILSMLAIRLRLSRSLMIAAMVTIAISAGVSFFGPSSRDDSAVFTTFWLRCEFAIWILTPWLMGMITALIMPTWWSSVFWISSATVYGIFSSAVRLCFCAGMLYYGGGALVLLLWSVCGVLADLLALCVFYSLAVCQATAWHRRSIRSVA